MVDHDDMRDMPPVDGTSLHPVELTPEDQAEIDRRNRLRGEQSDHRDLSELPSARWRSKRATP